MRRFPIVPAPPGSSDFNLGVTVPPKGAVGTGGGACTVSGPYLAACVIQIPDADSRLFVFGLYGLAEDDEVVWTASLSTGDHVIGLLTTHVLMIQDTYGDGGTVTATVNGTEIGSTAYGSSVSDGCVSPYASEG